MTDEKATGLRSGQATTYIAFDIETAGSNFDNPVLQVGVAVGQSAKNIATASWCFDHPDSAFEKRCKDEFWSKNTDILTRIQTEAKASGKSNEQQWQDFADFMQAMYKRCEDRLELVSDNPSFDISRIDNELRDRRLKKSGLRYSPYPRDNTYLPVHDPTERIKGFGKAKAERIRADVAKVAAHTHWAEDDAKNILLLEFAAQEEAAATA